MPDWYDRFILASISDWLWGFEEAEKVQGPESMGLTWYIGNRTSGAIFLPAGWSGVPLRQSGQCLRRYDYTKEKTCPMQALD
jgi:hypothetical protein